MQNEKFLIKVATRTKKNFCLTIDTSQKVKKKENIRSDGEVLRCEFDRDHTKAVIIIIMTLFKQEAQLDKSNLP